MAQDICPIVGGEGPPRREAIIGERNRVHEYVGRARIAPGSWTVAVIARRAGVGRPAAWRWQRRFAEAGIHGLLLTCAESPGEATHWTGRAIARRKPGAPAAWTVGAVKESLPDPVPKPPGLPPGEPIIIKNPRRPPEEMPEIDGSLDEDDDPEIKKPPEIVPEKPPPPAPWDRADRVVRGLRLQRDRSGSS